MAPIPTGSVSAVNTQQRWGKHGVSGRAPKFSIFSFTPSPVLLFLLLQHVIPISCVPGQPTQSQFRAGALLQWAVFNLMPCYLLASCKSTAEKG